MAVLAAILPIVSRSSVLALHLYQLAATEADAAKDIVATAKSINNVSLIVKQIGTIIKEDDRLPSSEVYFQPHFFSFKLTVFHRLLKPLKMFLTSAVQS
jgi:hypothetical protein